MYQIIKNYRNNQQLRHSFNVLAMKTFHINFEDWYQNGYWTDRYNPYSIVIDGEIASNVSVNSCISEINGERKQYIQLGTVMTDKRHRNKGLIRAIMEEIDRDYAKCIDGMFLFANNTVLDFYPKFGFRAAKQYEYFRKVVGSEQSLFQPISMAEKKDWDMLEAQIKTCFRHSAVELLDNTQLNMFYITKYLQKNVYYSAELEAYVIAEPDNGTVLINMVISDKEQDMKQIADGFGKEFSQVVLGFTPKKTSGFELREMEQDDTVLHIKGDLNIIEESKLMFPLLMHA